ncbi:uncharacterized protein LOC115627244 [Scaptodrosophila lebanonensis]|uniref:Uncharacterized protein LOC115627244 n=1 Tax=Drosophila lebanonensis TaxID=7225 RepID=A0A6J2TRQ7_DROLE|nr:uncharacterized protein LOC115627244 [Scaptodrosophila lebanonensis]XP_030378738.1 uncharacterized protein LOC115627244 [Scaptodrosophila lebanonensis]
MDKFLKSGNIKEVDESVEHSGKRKGRQKSDIWNFFTRLPGGTSANCKTCGLDYRTGGNTTILFNHLLRAHTTLSHESKPVATIKTFFSSNNYYENNSAHKKELDKALTRMIAIDMQPFRIVEDRGFRDFVYYLNPRYILPSRTTLRNVHLQNMYNEMKEKLVLILNNVEYCAVTTDSWTSRANEFYVTVTCHFIDKNFVLREAVLSTCSSYGNPTPDIEEPPTHPDYPSTKTSQIYAFVQDKIAQKQSRTPQADGIILVRQYLEKPHELQGTPPLEYWKTHVHEMQHFQNCIFKYLCIPACSTASERMFSKAGCILSDRRAALKPFIVNQLLFTNKNQWLNE